MYAAQLLHNNAKNVERFYEFPQIRVLGILNFVLDSSQPGIYNVQMFDSSSTKLLNQDILWTYIQLPKLIEEGTNNNNKWLQLLSTGVNKDIFVHFENTQSFNDNFNSGISLLNSYIHTIKHEKMLEESKAFFEEQVVQALKKELIEKMEINCQVERNKMYVNGVLNLKQKEGFSNEKISEILNISLDFVNFVMVIVDLSHKYLDFCAENDDQPQYQEFLEEARKLYRKQ